MKTNRLYFLLLTVALMIPVQAFAGGISCTATTGLVPDGRTLEFDAVQPGSTAYYSFATLAGRSYSIEARDDVDSNPGNDLQFQYYSLAAQPAGWNCANGSAMTAGTAPNYTSTQYRDTTALEPKLVSGQRVSVPAPANDTIIIAVKNSGSLAHYVSVSVTETTLYAMNWSTYGNLNTSFNFQNTTSQPVTYSLTVVATVGGTQTVTATATLPAISTASSYGGKGTSDLGFAAQQAGNAICTHDGPPAALQAWALLTNYGTTPYTLIPIPFGPLRGK